jgi:hypothetical protein
MSAFYILRIWLQHAYAWSYFFLLILFYSCWSYCLGILFMPELMFVSVGHFGSTRGTNFSCFVRKR